MFPNQDRTCTPRCLRRDADHSRPSSDEVENEKKLYYLFPRAPTWHVAGQVFYPSSPTTHLNFPRHDPMNTTRFAQYNNVCHAWLDECDVEKFKTEFWLEILVAINA